MLEPHNAGQALRCRHCHASLEHMFLDLGSAPPSNAYLKSEDLNKPEVWLPLKVMVCESCWLVQTIDFAGREHLFNEEYAYFSSCSSSWLRHAENFVLDVTKRFELDENSLVLEVAANDGYLLQYVKREGIPCYGVEPTTSTAMAARAKGLTIIEEFFGTEFSQKLCGEGRQVDLSVANNVLAHVPDLNDFVAGFAMILKPDGVASFEFPHLLNLVAQNQFDTVYHEHYSYLSLIAVKTIFEKNGLQIFDVQTLPTHGGSLRVFAQRADSGKRLVADAVQHLLDEERNAGMTHLSFYQQAQARAEAAKFGLLEFLLSAKKEGKRVAAYGAAAKGNTLLNFAGVRQDLLDFVVDINPHKQGKYLPGSRIPIVGLDYLAQAKPDYLLVLPWNLLPEIRTQLGQQYQLVVAIPSLEIKGT